MKKNSSTIKIEVFKYFSIFVISFLGFLWIFQIVFLSTFYKFIKIQDIKTSAYKISQNFTKEYIEEITIKKDFSVLILDSKGTTKYLIASSPRSSLLSASHESLSRYTGLALERNGEYLERGFISKRYKEGKKFSFSNNLFSKPENMLYTKIINVDNHFYTMFLETTISPVDSTVGTLRWQLMIITAIMLIISGLLAVSISKKISRPIEDITLSAKSLANGNYKEAKVEQGYSEINDLAKTLNYAAQEIKKNEQYSSDLVANLSHDLRTPLTMIIGYSELIRDFPEDEELQNNIQVIIDESKRLTNLVNDAIDRAKYESGMADINKEEFNLSEEIKMTINRFVTLTNYNIKYSSNSEKETFVYADKLQMSQVIYNLLSNALNYTGDDKTIYVNEIIKDNKVRIEIIDTGEGISKEKLPDIWQRYYKIDKIHKRPVVGSGLGLSIVKSILIKHSANYGVKSEEGKGSNFWFELDTLK